MFQKVSKSTSNVRGFAPFWFFQIRGHSLRYNTQDVWFSSSFKEISKQLTGNPPRCKTQICTKLIGVVIHLIPQWFSEKSDGPKTHQIDWEWSQNASPKAISTLDKNYPLQPHAKLEVTKIEHGKIIKFISNNPNPCENAWSVSDQGLIRDWSDPIKFWSGFSISDQRLIRLWSERPQKIFLSPTSDQSLIRASTENISESYLWSGSDQR